MEKQTFYLGMGVIGCVALGLVVLLVAILVNARSAPAAPGTSAEPPDRAMQWFEDEGGEWLQDVYAPAQPWPVVPQPAHQAVPSPAATPALAPDSVPQPLHTTGATPAPASQPSAPPAPPVRDHRLVDITPPEGAGARAYLYRSDASDSALAVARGGLDALGTVLDGPPTLLNGMQDARDREVQLAFAAQSAGTVVQGLAYAAIPSDGQPQARMVFVPVGAGPEAFRWLSIAQPQQPAGQDAGPRRPEYQWQRVDTGGATAEIPTTWRVNPGGMAGTLSVSGPEGQLIELGIPAQVIDSSGPGAQMAMQYGYLVAPYSDPVTAIPNVLPRLAQMANQRLQVTRVVESTPVQAPQGQGAFVHYEINLNGALQQCFGLVITWPIPPGVWMYYSSVVSAPPEVFRRDLEAMLRVWQSWSVSDAVIRQRLRAAAESMREVGEIIRSTHQQRDRVAAEAHAKWSEYIRGTRLVRDSETGQTREEWAHHEGRHIEDVIQSSNEAAGYERYRQIPRHMLDR